MPTNRKAPKVSVIIPNYNHARYLEARIESVINQSFQDFEVILLDDASTDDSKQIIEKYRGHPRVQIILNDKNSGSAFIQWRKGVGHSSGAYVWIAESDDIADLNLLETLVQILDANPDVVLAYCQSSYINENGEVTGSALTWTNDLDAERWKHDFIEPWQGRVHRISVDQKHHSQCQRCAVQEGRIFKDQYRNADEIMRRLVDLEQTGPTG